LQTTQLLGTIGTKNINSRDFKLTSNIPIRWDSPTKTALLTTLAGYLQEDSISINDTSYYDAITLNNFLSYVLNDKRAAPRSYALDVTFTEVSEAGASSEKSFYPESHADCLIAFSGGVDSTAGVLYALEKGWHVQPIWIGFGQKNEEQERHIVEQISQALHVNTWYITLNLQSFVDAGWQTWKSGIIPARNYLFASFAAQLAAMAASSAVQIFICAHKEEVTDVNTDKSPRFFQTCSTIFTQAYEKEISVATPFMHITKPEIVNYWWRNWKDVYGIRPHDTVSCYQGICCGVCKACINRAIAFSCAQVPLEDFQTNPFYDEQNIITQDYLQRFPALDISRKLDFLYALQRNRTVLKQNIISFLDEHSPNYSALLEQRMIEIRQCSL
jgi:7-cyano-7-deazaguanine synthase in queuosine biosynthesis